MNQQRERGEEIVGAVAEAAGELGIACKAAVRSSIMHREILSQVEDNEIDLLVMGHEA